MGKTESWAIKSYTACHGNVPKIGWWLKGLQQKNDPQSEHFFDNPNKRLEKIKYATMISGDLGCMGKERFQDLREEIGKAERILKAIIRCPENKHLNP
jgi:hypothetical protein